MISLSRGKKIYFIGIKGTAMSALAIICKQMGMKVFGSDTSEVFITDAVLREQKIKFFETFKAKNLDVHPDYVVLGTSWHDDNVEIARAKKRGLETITDSQLRGMLSEKKKTIAVTGMHGKTTSTALLAYIFESANKKPSWLVGTGHIFGLGENGHWGNGKHFIVEGDEYVKSFHDLEPKFLDLKPRHTIITSLEWEHVDVYKNLEALEQAFTKLIANTKGKIIACSDWDSIQAITKGLHDKVITYGFGNKAEWQISNFQQAKEGIWFALKKHGKDFASFQLPIFGRHNALNATACIIASDLEGIKLSTIAKALHSFKGLERRFEIQTHDDITYVDDYGHHPTEISSTLHAIREKFPKQTIWCAFQPHMASRTKALLHDFKDIFNAIDHVCIVDIFESAREHGQKISSKGLVKAIGRGNVIYSGSIKETTQYLKKNIKKGDIVVTMGAGDVYKIRDTLIK